MHEDYEALEEEYRKERIELEKKYLAKKEEFYGKRQPIISGEVDVPKTEGEEEVGTEETDDKGVPQFWLTALSSHPSIGETITEDDVPALEALANITVAYNEDFSSFTLSFHFKENEFFKNAVLTKKYSVTPDLLDDKNPNLSEAEGCVIEWKEGKNLCVTEIKKKQKAKSGRNKGQVRTVTRTVPKASFFHYFDEHKEDDEEEEKEEEEEEEEGLGRKKFSIEEDYDIGHTIRTSIIPEAILWFTGEAAYDYDNLMFGDDDDDEDIEDGEEDEEDEEEEEEEAPKKGGKKSKGGLAAPAGPAGGANGQQPECKQN
jgi:nucleosome assembly protein 1-like 1